ncbi:MAG TPA: DNA sulfur modification protein DndB [Methyloceanibacter sp.]|nr:DNA sulfur modification protein DndB [Methyloceanibacter sp.]
MYEYLQRKTSKDRRESVSLYIEERLGPDAVAVGGFPALSIALQQPTEFVSYSSANPALAISGAVGYLNIDIAPTNFRVLIDGLARVTGALDEGDEGHGDLLDNFMFPVTIYVPRPGTKPFTWKEMGQLFHDFNFRVHPVSKQLAVALDTSDLYIALANKLAECPVFKEHGGVAERRASLGGKSTELVVQTVLVRAVRGACEGRKFQESNLATTDEPNLTQVTFKSILASLDQFFSGIAERMGEERFTDRQSLHLSSPGWQALGVIHHDIAFRLTLDAVERAKVLDKIAGIDWSRFNKDWLTLGYRPSRG